MESRLIKLFVVRAVAIVLIYALCDAIGWRDYASVISGTSPDPAGMTLAAALKAVIYILLFLATFIVVPILLISSALILVWTMIRNRFAVLAGSSSAKSIRMAVTNENANHLGAGTR